MGEGIWGEGRDGGVSIVKVSVRSSVLNLQIDCPLREKCRLSSHTLKKQPKRTRIQCLERQSENMGGKNYNE